MIVLSSILLMTISAKAEEISRWHNPTAPVQRVFLQNEGSVTEVLKLFKDSTYDFLKYEYIKDERFGVSRNYCTVTRDTGTYSLKFKKLILSPGVQSKNTHGVLTTFWISSNGSLYGTLMASLMKRSASYFHETKDRSYKMPFYIDPISGVIVDNPEAKDRIDLQELVRYLIKGATNERDKFSRIALFIMNSIDYDYPKLSNSQPPEASYEIRAILAGPYRFGVCADYSRIAVKLCEYAGLTCRYVTGAAKNSAADLNSNSLSNHAWNILKIGNIQEIHDITWEDVTRRGIWMNVSPSLMIYSHFPDDVKDQLLEKPMNYQDFNGSPIIMPEVANARIGFSFPTQGKIFFKDAVSLNFKGNRGSIESYLFEGEISNIVYKDEESKFRTFRSIDTDEIKTVRIGNQTTLRLKTERRSCLLTLRLDGVEINYLLINSDKDAYWKSLQAEGDRRYKDAYLKAIVASIALSDARTLTQLAGKNKHVFI
ncbi:MAG: transglutaminase domain-containing protein, partial [Bacteroidota bacterium]